MPDVLMACGHRAQTLYDGKPACVICAGLKPEAFIVAELPNLENRSAKCVYCVKSMPSSIELAFFEVCPGLPNDRYYCGCRGWD